MGRRWGKKCAKRRPGWVGVPEGPKQQETPKCGPQGPSAPPTMVSPEVMPVRFLPWVPGWPLES